MCLLFETKFWLPLNLFVQIHGPSAHTTDENFISVAFDRRVESVNRETKNVIIVEFEKVSGKGYKVQQHER